MNFGIRRPNWMPWNMSSSGNFDFSFLKWSNTYPLVLLSICVALAKHTMFQLLWSLWIFIVHAIDFSWSSDLVHITYLANIIYYYNLPSRFSFMRKLTSIEYWFTRIHSRFMHKYYLINVHVQYYEVLLILIFTNKTSLKKLPSFLITHTKWDIGKLGEFIWCLYHHLDLTTDSSQFL